MEDILVIMCGANFEVFGGGKVGRDCGGQQEDTLCLEDYFGEIIWNFVRLEATRLLRLCLVVDCTVSMDLGYAFC